jgi:hypothetical protein
VSEKNISRGEKLKKNRMSLRKEKTQNVFAPTDTERKLSRLMKKRKKKQNVFAWNKKKYVIPFWIPSPSTG